MECPAETYKIIGLMSGTSLDGLDVAYCEFQHQDNKWDFAIPFAKTYFYHDEWKEKLSVAHRLTGKQLALLDIEFGKYCGQTALEFIKETGYEPSYLSSHGHTIFHRPDVGYTLQVGSGAAISAMSGITTICDFRTQDVLLGGQGAPLVPVGDHYLFSNYDYCLNIGGFANISHKSSGTRKAWDICPANIILNRMAQRAGFDYDENGRIGASGSLIPVLFERLNNLDFYNKLPPKSLGAEWLESMFLPVVADYAHFPLQDIMRTLVEHISFQVSRPVSQPNGHYSILVTGGGACNRFLMECIRQKTRLNLVIPDDTIVHFKEALIFAFLGVLRIRGECNCLASVTGATKDHCSGTVYMGK